MSETHTRIGDGLPSMAKQFMSNMTPEKEQGLKKIQEAIAIVGFENFRKGTHQKIDAGSESEAQKKREHAILNEMLEIIVKRDKIEKFQAKLAMLEERKEEIEADLKQDNDLETTITKQDELETVKNHIRINKMIIASIERDLEVVN